ncbi:group II intron maturase-specific domain-containing protein [uncultured Gemmiger sp.]|uniref:group II intron maturase-specific domain-containing protein n=1 Tax=uncultured Gemmiger sp. TaxID=1623490 RepID=UPI0034A0C429
MGFFRFCARQEQQPGGEHRKSLARAKKTLKLLTKQNRRRNVRRVMQEVKVSIRGWIGYFRVAYEADADVLR